MNLIFLDTETTGLDDKARLVQLAYKSVETDETVNQLFKPPTPIGFDAMSVTNITNEMVEHKQEFLHSEERKILQILLQTDGCLVAHNAKYDIKILENEGLKIENFICTEKVARTVIESENYKLQYLRYSLGLYKKINDSEAAAHDALGDIIVLEKLFEYLVEKISDGQDNINVFEKMIEISRQPILLKKIEFGKYKNMEFERLAKIDRGYLEWLKGQDFVRENENLEYTIRYYLSL